MNWNKLNEQSVITNKMNNQTKFDTRIQDDFVKKPERTWLDDCTEYNDCSICPHGYSETGLTYRCNANKSEARD